MFIHLKRLLIEAYHFFWQNRAASRNIYSSLLYHIPILWLICVDCWDTGQVKFSTLSSAPQECVLVLLVFDDHNLFHTLLQQLQIIIKATRMSSFFTMHWSQVMTEAKKNYYIGLQIATFERNFPLISFSICRRDVPSSSSHCWSIATNSVSQESKSSD